jgi:hypothetical protein
MSDSMDHLVALSLHLLNLPFSQQLQVLLHLQQNASELRSFNIVCLYMYFVVKDAMEI